MTMGQAVDAVTAGRRRDGGIEGLGLEPNAASYVSPSGVATAPNGAVISEGWLS